MKIITISKIGLTDGEPSRHALPEGEPWLFGGVRSRRPGLRVLSPRTLGRSVCAKRVAIGAHSASIKLIVHHFADGFKQLCPVFRELLCLV